ncbi:rhomboid family intramembrane serine protease [Winogradskyella aquimaris]|uniref:Rhomboid family intramembrane serine protease n=1 Tax=Winogradskyella aquimaris TaxID=864074 RepID=A0ABU5ERF6_9FLAO|nr:rhomboid family intramembrane serine protease [Winogradskyella aquimaris]MDY2588138.1 rhomboid family intramembrane serine protease [Winogradskyella aquimaris]
MTTIESLKYRYNNLDVFGKIITINAVVFIIDVILTSLFRLNVVKYFVLPANFGDFITQPWSILTYGFLHSGFFHLLFNMLFLFYLSRVASNLFRTKMVLNIYLLGILAGGMAYLGVSNIDPTNFFGTKNGIMVGASAGVSALLMFVAVYMPNSEIRLFNTFNVRWMHIAIFFVAMDVFRLLLGINQGGYVAHVGGYILGYYYAKQLVKGKDIGLGFERMMDSFASWFKPKSNLKTVHRSKRSASKRASKSKSSEKNDKQKKIDAILDKISKSGYESLTSEEKAFLFDASKDN